MTELVAILLVFSPIVWWVWWMNKDNPQPKYDFGPEKGHGILYYIWNWKKYLFRLLLIVFMGIGFYDSGLTGMVSAVMILYGLKLLGKLF